MVHHRYSDHYRDHLHKPNTYYNRGTRVGPFCVQVAFYSSSSVKRVHSSAVIPDMMNSLSSAVKCGIARCITTPRFHSLYWSGVMGISSVLSMPDSTLVRVISMTSFLPIGKRGHSCPL